MKDNTKNVVKRIIQQNTQDNKRVTIQSIISHLNDTIDSAKIIEAIKNLSIEGQIYTTADESIKFVIGI